MLDGSMLSQTSLWGSLSFNHTKRGVAAMVLATRDVMKHPAVLLDLLVRKTSVYLYSEVLI